MLCSTAALDQVDNLLLRVRIGLDVALRCAQIGVTGKQLNISNRSTYARYLPSGIGDERPTSAVA
jgi:hypothetical protein